MAAIYFIAAFCLLLSGCVNSDNVVYTKFKSLSNQEWHKGQYLEFDLDSVADEDSNYDVLLVVRHNDTYKYNSMCVVVEEFVQGESETTDSIDIKMANEDGRWVGRGQYGLYEVIDTLKRGDRLSKRYLISVCHGMRCVTVEGVSDVGIVVKRLNKYEKCIDQN